MKASITQPPVRQDRSAANAVSGKNAKKSFVIQKMDPEKKTTTTTPQTQALSTAAYTQEGNVSWRLNKNEDGLEFLLADGTRFSTDEKEFNFMLSLLWKRRAAADLNSISRAFVIAIMGISNPLNKLIVGGFKEKAITTMRQVQAGVGQRTGSDLDSFLKHIAQLFSSAIGLPSILNVQEIMRNPKWDAGSVQGNKIRRKIILVAIEALQGVTKPQKNLWEGNAGDYTEEDLGLVDSRINTYAALVKNYAVKIRGEQVNAAVQITGLCNIAANTLLPELSNLGLFPQLELVGFGEDCLFSKDSWKIKIGIAPVPVEVIDELSSSILHEIRHVEQAWALCTISSPRTKLSINEKIVASIRSGCPYPRKYKQVTETAKRGEEKTINWDNIETLQTKLGLTLREDVPVDSIDWSDLQKFFHAISWYYNHPREYDAYGSEQKYQVAYRKA